MSVRKTLESFAVKWAIDYLFVDPENRLLRVINIVDKESGMSGLAKTDVDCLIQQG